MKNIRKFLTLLMAFAMCMSLMSISALADNQNTFKVHDKSKAYTGDEELVIYFSAESVEDASDSYTPTSFHGEHWVVNTGDKTYTPEQLQRVTIDGEEVNAEAYCAQGNGALNIDISPIAPAPQPPVTNTYYYQVIYHYTATVNGETVVNDEVASDIFETNETSVNLKDEETVSYTDKTGEHTFDYTLAEGSSIGGETGTKDSPAVFDVYYTYSATSGNNNPPAGGDDTRPNHRPSTRTESQPTEVEDIVEEETPLSAAPVELEKEPTPLAAAPELPAEEMEEFEEEDVPLAAVPATSDVALFWLAASAFSGLGLGALNLKKREEEN